MGSTDLLALLGEVSSIQGMHKAIFTCLFLGGGGVSALQAQQRSTMALLEEPGSYSVRRGGANHLCMPTDPEYNPVGREGELRGPNGVARIYGAEYETGSTRYENERDPSCAVCYAATRSTVMMIPAKYTCPPSWTLEYYGYLIAAYEGGRRSTFECVDKDLESVPGS